jgi:elongation factor P--(R)-beta-lysine ligase
MNQNRHPDIRINLELRAKVIVSIRCYFQSKGYLEVETPIRIPAPAPEEHIDAQPSGSWFLHTSPELCMKRLLANGFERIFQICKCFRKGERGHLHLPEMTMLEWYTAGHDYLDMMRQCEDLISTVAQSIGPAERIHYQGQEIDLTEPWHRMTVKEAFETFASVSLSTATKNGTFDEIIACDIAPQLGLEKPVFLFDYPAELGSLARLKQADKSVAERFELYIAGIEICNAFSELTDPVEQHQRFRAEMDQRRSSGKTVYPLSEPFLEALKTMPDSAGNALGLDRLIMLFADATDIDEVVAFTPENG